MSPLEITNQVRSWSWSSKLPSRHQEVDNSYYLVLSVMDRWSCLPCFTECVQAARIIHAAFGLNIVTHCRDRRAEPRWNSPAISLLQSATRYSCFWNDWDKIHSRPCASFILNMTWFLRWEGAIFCTLSKLFKRKHLAMLELPAYKRIDRLHQVSKLIFENLVFA